MVEDLALALSNLARALHAEPDVAGTAAAIATAATAIIPGAVHAGVTLVGRGVTVPVPRDGQLPAIDALLTELSEGPGMTAIADQVAVRCADLTVDERWPLFARRAQALGVRSVLALPLRVDHQDLGALTVCSTQPDALGAAAEAVAAPFVAHAAVALSSAHRRHHLSAKASSRDIVGQAKGILMERHQVDAAAAFDVLLRSSSHTNRKLHDIAQALIDTRLEPPRSFRGEHRRARGRR